MTGGLAGIGLPVPVARPKRPARPELRPPREMPRRRNLQTLKARVALLHALAHIEFNAIDLACDMIARFADFALPPAYYDDWCTVAGDEARHFRLLQRRLDHYGAAYGDLPAHDGLWQAATDTAHDLLTRLAVVPLVLEARGLDVTPAMATRLRDAGDAESAAVLESIYRDELTHVTAGARWFRHCCDARSLEPRDTWQRLVRQNFKGQLRGPFNDGARAAAGLPQTFYRPLAAASQSRLKDPT